MNAFMNNILDDDSSGMDREYERLLDIIDPNVKPVTLRAILHCADYVVNNQAISTEDFLLYWAYFQHGIANRSIPDALDGTLTDLLNNKANIPEIINAIINYAKSHPEEVTFNDDLSILGRGEQDTEKKFILNHKEALLKRCPVQFDGKYKTQWQVIKQNCSEEQLLFYLRLCYLIKKCGAFPQFWNILMPFAHQNDNEITLEIKKQILDIISQKYNLDKSWLVDETFKEALEELELKISNANSYKEISVKELLEELQS